MKLSSMKSILTPLVSICVPFSRCVLPKWHISTKSIVPPISGTSQDLYRENWPRDEARNDMAEEAQGLGSKFILCLDDDVTVRSDMLRRLLFQMSNTPDDVMVIGGVYTSKEDPPQPLVYQHVEEGPFYKWRLGDVFEVDVVATGMMLIKTEVFKHLEKPYFKDIETIEDGIKYNLIPEEFNGSQFSMTDDVFFCRKVKEAGFKVLAHGGVLGVHWDERGSAYLLPDNSYPIMFEMVKRWGKLMPTEKEYKRRYNTIVKDWYGNFDLLPLPQDEDDDVAEVGVGCITQENSPE